MLQFKGARTFTVLLHVLVHPFFVIVQEYVPALETVIQRDVAPVLHKREVRPVGTQSVVEDPEQMVLLPVIEQTSGVTVTVLLQVTKQPLMHSVNV